MCRARWRLGLTATPVEDVARRARVDMLLGEVVYRCEIVDLAGRFLAPFRVTTLAVPLSARERVAVAAETSLWKPVVRAWFGAVPEASWADFVRACQGSDEGRRALAAWRRTRAMLTLTEGKLAVVGRLLLRHASSRVLVFLPDAVSAWALGRALLVPVITADVSSAERARILAAFVDGTVRVVVSARVLNEGVDVPAADVAVLVGDSRGVREYTQRVGRVLRPQEGKEALVYEVVTVGTGEVDRAERRQVAIGLG
jgi:superfamily II DNA or RNA helicase